MIISNFVYQAILQFTFSINDENEFYLVIGRLGFALKTFSLL